MAGDSDLGRSAVSIFKAETYRFLRLDRPGDDAAGSGPPAGTIHLPGWVDSEWVKQLVAEQLLTMKTERGFQRLEWQKLRERNEALDWRVYVRAATGIAEAETELLALRRAYASGKRRVSHDCRSVEYGSAEDLLRRIRPIEGEMAAAQCKSNPRRGYRKTIALDGG